MTSFPQGSHLLKFYAVRKSPGRSLEERRIEAIRLHEEAAQELRQKRIDLAEQALDRISRAERLRSLIAAFDEKVSHGNAPVSGYDQWRRWAVQHVQETDPRAMSLEHIERWIAQFRLDE